jgi:LuxR family transcriptional regulator, maltose regulon positive regulatory protein
MTLVVQGDATEGTILPGTEHSAYAPPPKPGPYVPRPRLLQLLDRAASRPLTLVVAPAGTGKTTLVAGWATEAAHPIAWLALDEEDRDAARLDARLRAVVDTLAPAAGRAGRPGAVLVIDDAHRVDESAGADDLLSGFLQLPPSWLHLVVASRREPTIPLDRLRGRGQVSEVRFAELRFTNDEARKLLCRLDPALAGNGADGVIDKADGWVAGLELAAFAARSARAGNEPFSPALIGPLVRDYVMHEVLAGESPELRDVLADVAVVPEAGPSLAKALTGRQDAGDLLRRAESRGLFVSRLPGQRPFAIAPPVRAALLAEQSAEDPDRVAGRHARAARWYEDAGETVPALEHWLLAGRPRQALALLAAQHAALYDRGLETVVAATLARIPAEVAHADVATMIEYAWCHLLVDRHRFAELVEKVDWWAQRSSPPPFPHLRHRITILRSIAATVDGCWVEGGELARDAVAAMGRGWWHDPLGRFGWNMAARELALSERWSGAPDEAHEAELALSRDPERRLTFEGTRALGEALSGRPVDALRVAAGVRQAAAVADMTILRYELSLAEAIARHELGERAVALLALRELATAPGGTMLFCQVIAAALLAQARLDDGDLAAAREDLHRAEALVATESFGRDGRSWVARAGTVVALAEGAVGRARAYADQVVDPFWGPVCRARVDLAGGDGTDAVAALRQAAPRCGRHEVVRALLQARAVDDHDEAVRLTTAAVSQAVALNLLQTVATEGTEVVALVERAAWAAPEEWMGRLRRAVAPACEAAAAEGAVETLTGRERDVLRLLAGRLTVREIADELYVSPNTLKFHLKTIYRKLGVGSRAEAADVARRLTSVSPR